MALSSVQLIAAGDGSSAGTPVLRHSVPNSPVLHRNRPRCARKYRKDIYQATSKECRVKINVSGMVFETFDATLARFPDTLLGDKAKRLSYYDREQRCLFFNRCRISFEAVLFFYQSGGCLVRPLDKKMCDFEEECVFFGISDDAIMRMKQREGYARHHSKKSKVTDKTSREKLHEFLEHPDSSVPARVFAAFSMFTIITSVCMACISTIPRMRGGDMSVKENPLSVAEFTVNLFFGFELVLRFISSPSRLSFMKSPMNAIDFFAIFPYFVVLIIDKTQIANLGFLKAFRTVRVLRFLRFSRHSDTLHVVINIMGSTIRDLFTVVFCMLIMSIVWGSLAFYIELGTENTHFVSIPEGMWWAIQTIVCLGYGDIVPITLPGKIAAAVVAAVGALTLTVPLLSIGGRYLKMYSRTFSIHFSPDTNDEDNNNYKSRNHNSVKVAT